MSCAVTTQLISAFVFAIWIVQFLFFLILKFDRSICVAPGRKLRRPVFSHHGSNVLLKFTDAMTGLNLSLKLSLFRVGDKYSCF